MISSSQKQKPVGTRQIICPTCLRVTEHAVVEETVWLTLFGISTITLAKRAIFKCPNCGDTHSLDWPEYESRLAEERPLHEHAHKHSQSNEHGDPTQVIVKNRPMRKSASPSDPTERNLRRLLISLFIVLFLIAALVVVPVIVIIAR